MKVTFHTGELKRWEVQVKCVSHPFIQYNPENIVHVFAFDEANAKDAECEKLEDKFLRRQNKLTRWKAISEPREI